MEDKKWTIYKHTSPSGKSYIGFTSKDPEKRWLEGAGYNPKTKFGKAISKYGWEQFCHEILEDGISTLQEVRLPGKTIVCGHFHASWGHSHIHQDRKEFPAKNRKDWRESFVPFVDEGIIAIDACTAYTEFCNCLVVEV